MTCWLPLRCRPPWPIHRGRLVLGPVLLMLTLALPAVAQAQEVSPVLLAPRAFPHLPSALRSALQRRGCLVPQTAFKAEPHNVIRGQFARPGQIDWAVLCSHQGESTILVFWNGSPDRPAVLGRAPDTSFLQGDGRERFVYSREILPVGWRAILRNHRAYGGPTPPAIDHEGIDDTFVGKASVIFYFRNGRWHPLQGAD